MHTQPQLSRRHLRRAFTLIELLVVIAIVAILASILLSVYPGMIRKSHQVTTLSNMRQIGVTCLLYAADHNYMLPNRAAAQPGQAQPDKWPKLFQPYLQDTRVYVSPIPDVNGKSYKVTDPTLLVSNDANYTSYISNGYNDLGALTDSSVYPHLNNISKPDQTILFGIPYPQMNQFYMDFSEGAGNNNQVLNRSAFTDSSIYVFSDGSSRLLKYHAGDDMKSPPKTSDYYTDWLWLVDKTDTSIIQ